MTIGSITNSTAGPTAAGTPTAGPSGTSSSTSTTNSNEVSQLDNPDLFIKLLMAELENQSPTSPTTPSSILQQTSELSQVEAVTSMTKAVDQQEQVSENSEATSLVGQQVTAVVGGTTVSGAVSDVTLSSSGSPVLDVGGTQVPLSSVTQVGS